MMKAQYVKNRELTENNQLSDLSSDVVGIKTAKFAVVPTSKITLASTDVCGTNSEFQDNVTLIEVNGKPISNHDYNYLMVKKMKMNHSATAALAAKYG